MATTSGFTQKVQDGFNTLAATQAVFDNCLSDIEKVDMSAISPGAFLVALQNAGNCALALDSLDRSFEAEESENAETLKSLANSRHQKTESIKSKAISNASSIISGASRLKDFADHVGESVSSISELTPKNIFTDTDYGAPGPSGFESALSGAQNAAQEFKKDAFDTAITVALWSAGGSAVVSWISGVTFMLSLGIGCLAAAIVFGAYRSKKTTAAGTMRQLVKASGREFANIKKEKADEETKAQQECEEQCRQEEERFRLVKSDFESANESIEIKLNIGLSKFQNLSDKWQEHNTLLLSRSPALASNESSEKNGDKPSTSYAVLGMASFTSSAQNPSAGTSDEGDAPVEGQIYRGKVTRLADFGAFVNILPGKDGLVHISQIADHRIENVADELSEGQEVLVKVLGVDARGRIQLSIKEVIEGKQSADRAAI